MLCPLCDQEGVRYGRNRNGSQRWCCRACHHTFSETPAPQPRLFADRQLAVEKAVTAIRLLVEGNSVRSVCRLLGMGKPTLLGLLLRAGEGCKRLMAERVRNLPCTSVQCDELLDRHRTEVETSAGLRGRQAGPRHRVQVPSEPSRCHARNLADRHGRPGHLPERDSVGVRPASEPRADREDIRNASAG
jgi:transposase-like protein